MCFPLENHNAQNYSLQDVTSSILHSNDPVWALEFRGSMISFFSDLPGRTHNFRCENISSSLVGGEKNIYRKEKKRKESRDPGHKPIKVLILSLLVRVLVIWSKLFHLWDFFFIFIIGTDYVFILRLPGNKRLRWCTYQIIGLSAYDIFPLPGHLTNGLLSLTLVWLPISCLGSDSFVE